MNDLNNNNNENLINNDSVNNNSVNPSIVNNTDINSNINTSSSTNTIYNSSINTNGDSDVVSRRRSNYSTEYDVEPRKRASTISIVIRTVLAMIILFLLFILLTDNKNNIVYRNLVSKKIEVSKLTPNKYYREYDYNYVQITNDFYAKDKQHLLNIYYTIANSGASTFTFACSTEYKECLDDVDAISNDSLVLSNIKDFIHPFNSFASIGTQYSTQGEVILTIEKVYKDEEIKEIENKIEEIVNKNGKDLNDPRKIIKTYHDYIINNTKYDTDRTNRNIINYKSDTAYGPLIQGYALCGGYADAMSLFLDYYNIKNFRVNSQTHIWNAVYYNDNWYHIDLTWDDPITTSGKDVLRNSYFLITTSELFELEKTEHNFDKNVFSELNNSV